MPVAQRTQHVRVVGAHRVWPVIVPDGVKNTLSSCHVWVRWMRRQNERAPRGGICTEEMTVHRKGQVERERADALVGQSEGGTESTDRLCTGETAGVRVLFRYSLTQTVFNKSREQFDPLTGLWWPPPFRLPRLCLFHCHHTVGEGNRSPTAVRDSKRHEWTRGRVRGRTGTSPRCRHPTWTRGKQSLGGRSSAGHQLANERRKESAEQCRGWGRVRPSSLGSAHQAQQGRFRGGGQGRPRRRTAHSRPPASSWPGIQIYCRGGVAQAHLHSSPHATAKWDAKFKHQSKRDCCHSIKNACYSRQTYQAANRPPIMLPLNRSMVVSLRVSSGKAWCNFVSMQPAVEQMVRMCGD
eukprot:GGOE01010663.1.p1 GENE.GGOE01010663.1~~GGOE01010663.1.p1  ORF type:complete len:353 (+),score=-39.37 GGOE01010663.1:451-1509(+)